MHFLKLIFSFVELFCAFRIKTISAFFLLFTIHVNSQTYPVQISNQLIPPYSGYLPDYADPSSEKLRVILQFNDFTTPQYNVRLKIEIKGNGFTISTKQFYNPPPLTLLPGIPLLLSGADIAPYLNSNNLDFIGINKSQYEQRMALPEGFYTICIKAYDYYNPGNIQISNEACAQAWFTLSDPPFLNLPLCNSYVTPQTPQNLVFQWTPMNMGSPLSAANTEYEFALWEVRPDSSANANQIVLSTAPIYSTTTTLTFLNYGITEPALNLYMKYVWRVRVKDITGRDWFKNNGYSQICTFTYGNVVSVLGNALNLTLSAQGVTHRLGKCTWNTQSLFSSYLLQVRKEGTTNWFDYPTITGTEKVTNLEPNTNYEARVRGEGSGITGGWSNTATFVTQNEPNYNCNDQTILTTPLQAQPLPAAKAITGLIIQTGQFEVTVSQINPSGPAGWYSGSGIARVYAGLPLAVEFKNIFIDDNNTQLQGTIQAVTKGISSWVQQWDVKYAEQNATYVNGTINNVTVSGSQICVVIQGHAGDSCFNYPADQNVVVIRDGNGNQFVVNLKPPPPKVTGPFNYFTFSADNLGANDSTMVTFLKSAAQQYGFDKKEYLPWINNYENIKLSDGKSYFVPYKSVGENSSDEVIAEIKIMNFVPAQLSFKTLGGAVLSMVASSTPYQYKITVPDNAVAVYAWYGTKKLGKLNVVSLKAQNKKVVVVPVNNANISSGTLQSELNKIFKQANVSWTVVMKPSYTFSLGTDGLQAADATLMTKYSSEMRALRDAYRASDTAYDKQAYHIFVVSNFSDPTLKGYMVRGRALGFATSSSSVKEIAHELAHGAFGLEHTFPAITKASSNNLLDYTTGTDLSNKQWETVQNPKVTFAWTDEEEDASFNGVKNNSAAVFDWINKIKIAYKNSTTVSAPAFTDFIGRTGSCYLGGIQYDSICVYVEVKSTNYNVLVHNKIEIKELFNFSEAGPVSYSAVVVGGSVTIQVPPSRLNNMKYYLENVQTFKNLILFVNGYRPIMNSNGDPGTLEYVNSNNVIQLGDTRDYWKGIDGMFMNRIGTRTAVYADGHHSITTSNHISTLVFAADFAAAKVAKVGCLTYPSGSICNDNIYLRNNPKNITGFGIRETNGGIAADDLIAKINSGSIVFNKQIDTLDIVAHSMGYAYAVGMIKKLKIAGIKFGRFYILAPENACSGGANWNDFKEVWQYGTDEANTKPYLQDGVASQCQVTGLDALTTARGGRVYIPSNFWPKGFLESHTVINYKWIFNKTVLEDGYVKPRN